MQREIIEKLLRWKNSLDRKPLVVQGARQVGKTWALKEFGRQYYKSFVYLNFDEEDELISIFEKNKNPERIIELLGLLTNTKIEKEHTLIIFDEIQESSQALNALKYFNEKANEYHIVAAGSLLGTFLAKPKSYPVGKVNLLTMHPMTFSEFLLAVDSGLFDYYMSIHKETVIEDIFHTKLLDVLNYYFIIGGMPEAVQSWITNKDSQKVQKIQSELLAIYENDFTKHSAHVNEARILLVFRSIASQLAKDNEKFLYGTLKEGARAREFELAIEWLSSAGMITKIHNVSKIQHPLQVYKILNHFKLFLFDTGLLKHMACVDNSAILVKTDFQFKGPLVENFVLQELTASYEQDFHYYSDKHSELDFLLEDKTTVIPLEVKAGENKTAVSFKNFIKNNDSTIAIRLSKRNYKREDIICNVPLYLAGRLKEFL